METNLMTLSNYDSKSCVYCIFDSEIVERKISQIINKNQEYFDLIKSGYIQVAVVKFELNGSKLLMRTFSNKGFEAACYYVNENEKLYLFNESFSRDVLYRKNGLHVVKYDENENGVMIYRMLDDDQLDPVGDGFTIDEAILFAENYCFAHDIEDN
jgi:hypothetical protein